RRQPLPAAPAARRGHRQGDRDLQRRHAPAPGLRRPEQSAVVRRRSDRAPDDLGAARVARRDTIGTMTTNPGPQPGEGVHRLEQQRREKRDAVAAMGLPVYGVATPGLISLTAAAAKYDERADAEQKERGKEPGFTDRRPVVKV